MAVIIMNFFIRIFYFAIIQIICFEGVNSGIFSCQSEISKSLDRPGLRQHEDPRAVGRMHHIADVDLAQAEAT